MADVSAVPFINFGLSQAQQGQADASANLDNQQAAVAGQQAQQQAMQTELLRRSMPMYRQAIDEAKAATSGNAQAPTGYEEAQADQSGTGPTPGGGAAAPNYDSPGAIAAMVKQQNYVEPFTQGEQKKFYAGAALAAMPGPAANPMLLNMAKYQQQFRTTNQAKVNALRSNQLYDSFTAAQSATNQNPLGSLRAIPGQDAVVAKITADHPGDVKAQQYAARRYAQLAAYNYHQYTGYPTELQNGIEIDTHRGAPVTGQDQILTGVGDKAKEDIYKDGLSTMQVTLKSGKTVPMAKWQAPEAQGGWGGVTPARKIMALNAAMQQPTYTANSTLPSPDAAGAAPGAAPGEASAPAQSAAAGAPQVRPTVRATPLPAGQRPPAPGDTPAVGAHLQQIRTQKAVDAQSPPSPSKPLPTLPQVGTADYAARMQMATSDKTFKAEWARTDLNSPGAPIPGADKGIDQYQDGKMKLAQDQSEVASTADAALQNFQAAKQIYDSQGGALTGPIGAMAQKAASVLGVDWQSVDGRQEISKYLVQAAISQLKQMYGSRPAAFDVKINLEQAFPNLDKMSPKAARDLIESQISQAQYLKEGARRSAQFVGSGGDPWKFGNWQSTYFPREHLLDSQYSKQKSSAPMQIRTVADYGKLNSGDSYIDPNGVRRTKS